MFRRARAVPRSQELVFLDADDDLGTIRSKLESTSAEEMYLYIPRRSPVLRTPLEFRMLARIANEMSSETIVITEDGTRRRLARQEGFQTRRSLRTLKHLMVGPGQRPPRVVLPDWLPVPGFAGVLTTIAFLGVVALAALVGLPVMRVTLVPQTTPVTRNVEVTVDPDARTPDVAAGTLPGEVLSVTLDVPGSLDVPSDRTIGKDRAHGEVVVTSRRTAAFTLPKDTLVRVADGPRFVTDQERPLPPGVPVRVGVTAEQPGTAGNVAPGQVTQFVGPNLEDLDVTNQRPMAGGTDRQAKVVADEDQARLRDQIMKDALNRGFAQLKQKAGSERTLPEAAIKVAANPGTEHFDQPPGSEADQLTGRLSVTVSGTAFQNLAFNDLVGHMLETGSGTDLYLTGAPKVGVPSVLKVDARKVMLRTEVAGVLERQLNPQLIGEALRGSTVQDARAYLGRLTGLAEPPVVELSPSWAPRAFRIDVNVRGAK